MPCPHCGYVGSPLDKECARCRQQGFAPPLPQSPPPAPPVLPAPVLSAAPFRPAPSSALRHLPLLIVTLMGVALISIAYRFRMRVSEDIQRRTQQSIEEDTAAIQIASQANRPARLLRPRPAVTAPSPSPEAVTLQLRMAQEQARQAEQQAQLLQQQVEALRQQRAADPGTYDREQREIHIQNALISQAQERRIAQERLQQAEREHRQQILLLQQQQERQRQDDQRRLRELQQQNQQLRDEPPPPAERGLGG